MTIWALPTMLITAVLIGCIKSWVPTPGKRAVVLALILALLALTATLVVVDGSPGGRL
jgi:hypothetical protein